MIIETKKGVNGHRIRRVEKPIDWRPAYRLANPNLPCIQLRFLGQDGIDYTIALSDDDIKKINEARTHYNDEFTKYAA